MKPVIAQCLDLFGLRTKDPITTEDLAAAAIAAIAGHLATRTHHWPSPATDAHHEWTPLGLALLGVIATHTQPDPRRRHSAQPTHHL